MALLLILKCFFNFNIVHGLKYLITENGHIVSNLHLLLPLSNSGIFKVGKARLMTHGLEHPFCYLLVEYHKDILKSVVFSFGKWESF